MKVNRINIKNIGPHKYLSVDLDKMGSIIAITGMNGAGKTYLLEAVPERPGIKR